MATYLFLNNMPKRIIKKIKALTGEMSQKKKKIDAKKKVQKKKIEERRIQKQQTVITRILEKKKKRLKRQLERFARQKKSLKGDYKARFPIFGRGRDEDAQEVERYESRLSMEHQLETDLQKIERALKRVKEGKYGICIVCGNKIKPERLRIYPEAEHCMNCHRKAL